MSETRDESKKEPRDGDRDVEDDVDALLTAKDDEDARLPDTSSASPDEPPAAEPEPVARGRSRDQHQADEETAREIMDRKLYGKQSDEERERVLAMFPMADEGPDDPNADRYAAAREIVGDPEKIRLAHAAAKARAEAARRAALLAKADGVDEEAVRLPRLAFHGLNGLAAAVILAGLVLHGLGFGPRGLDTWAAAGATIALLGALLLWQKADFRPPTLDMLDPRMDRLRVRHQRDLVLKAGAIVSSLFVLITLFIELIAFLVAVKAMEDLSATQITLAKNFVWIPAIMLLGVAGLHYVRTRIPSSEPAVPHQRHIELGLYVLMGLATFVGVLFSLGLGPIVRTTDIQARQGIYVQLLAVASLITLVNLRLGFPNVLGIIRREIEASREADRQSARSIHKRMVRNYVIALVFVVASVAFLVANAAGVVRASGSNQSDVFLIVYIMFAALILGIVLVNFYQAKQLRHKVYHMGTETGPIGRKRYDHAKAVRMTVTWVSVGLAGLFLFLTALVGTGIMTQLGPIALQPSNGTDFFVFAVLGGFGPYGFYWARENNRIRLIDEKFPDFLRDLAESQRAGMTLPRALYTSSKGEYGPLTKEIQTMSAQVEWGVNFTEALARFAKRTRTPLIQRTVSLVIEAAQSGGNVVDILSAASDDAREIKGILQERKVQMSVYSLIIYIAFGVFLTVIGVLNSQFIPQLAKSTASVAGADLGGIQFGVIDVPAFQQLFFHAALVQGIGGGLVSGVMTEGHPLSGMRHSFNMTLMSYVLFRFVIL